MSIRFLILGLALGLLAAGGCSKAYEIKVLTDFNRSAEFSAFHTFAFSGMTDRGQEIGAFDDTSPLRMRIKEIVNKQPPLRGFGRSAWKTIQTCWYTYYSACMMPISIRKLP